MKQPRMNQKTRGNAGRAIALANSDHARHGRTSASTVIDVNRAASETAWGVKPQRKPESTLCKMQPRAGNQTGGGRKIERAGPVESEYGSSSKRPNTRSRSIPMRDARAGHSWPTGLFWIKGMGSGRSERFEHPAPEQGRPGAFDGKKPAPEAGSTMSASSRA